uniref:Uncharacterized protein n=1 Tax=Arundo donax TaxID=35708 RepID=A0A0A9EGS7_ARUDO
MIGIDRVLMEETGTIMSHMKRCTKSRIHGKEPKAEVESGPSVED